MGLEYEKYKRKLYQDNPTFNKVVNVLIDVLKNTDLTAFDLQSAVILAIDKHRVDMRADFDSKILKKL